jgi:hypothetical protein
VSEAEEIPASPETPGGAADGQRGTAQAYRAHAREPRTVLFTMRMSAQDHTRIKAVALERRVSMARLMQESALSESYGRRERLAVVAALDAANRLLANVAGNINQLAHHANMANELVAHRELRGVLGEALRQIK